MNEIADFDYDRFISLQQVNLAHYMEAVIRNRSALVPGELLDRLLSELPRYDGYHLAYALQIGFDRSPEAFLPRLPHYLASAEAGVCSTVYNILDHLPASQVTQELVDSVRAVVSLGLPWKGLADIVDKLDARLKAQPR